MKKNIIQGALLVVVLVVLAVLGRPKLSALFYNRANELLEQGKPKEAQAIFKKALFFAPELAFIHYGLGNAYLEAKEEDDAIREYRRAAELDKGDIRPYLALSDIYESRGDFNKSLEILGEAKNKAGADSRLDQSISEASYRYAVKLVNSGLDSYLAGDKLKATSLLEKATKIKSDFTQGYYTLGYVYYLERNFIDAQRCLEKALDYDPSFWAAHKLIGDVYLQQGSYENMLSSYKKAIELRPHDPQLYNDLALALMQMEHYGEAIDYMRKALELDPNSIDKNYSLASLYRDSRRFNEALEQYKKVLGKQQDYPNIHNDIADIYESQGNGSLALKEYNKEIGYSQARLKKDPGDPVSNTCLAYALKGIGKAWEAKKIIDKVIAAHPDYRQAYITLARINEAFGDMAGAAAALDKAKALSVSSRFIQSDLDRFSFPDKD